MSFIQSIVAPFIFSISLQEPINLSIEIPKFEIAQVQDQNILDNREIEATNLYKQARDLYKSGQYQRAISLYQDSLIIWQLLGRKNMIGNSLNAIGSAYYQLDKYETSISFYEKALKIYQEIKDPISEAKMIYAIAASYSELGETLKAISIYPKALEVFEKLGDRLNQAKVLINIAIDYRKIGQYSQALKQYQRAIPLLNDATNKNELSILNNGLGSVYSGLGKYDDALIFYQKAIDIFNNDNSIQSLRNKAIYINNLGYVFVLQKKYDLALKKFQESLNISQKLEQNLNQGIALSNIGFANIKLGNNNDAIKDLFSALKIIREYKDKDFEARILDSLGDVYKQIGNYGQSLIFYQEGLIVARGSGDRTTEAMTLSNLGELFSKQGKVTTAIAFYKKSVQTTEAIRQDLTSLPIEQQKSYAETVAYTYRALADLLLSQGRILEAQQVLELLKIQEIRDFTKDTRAGGTDELVKLSPKESSVINPIDSLIKLGLEIEKCQNICSDAVTKHLKDQRMAVTEEFHNTVDLLEKDSKDRLAKDDGFFRPNKIKNKSEDIVRAQPNTVLIYTFVQKDRTWILWASKGAITKSIEIPKIGREQISKLVFELRSQLSKPNTDIKQLKSTSKKIYDILIPQSLQSELDKNNIQNLVFSLDSVTRYVPMSVLFDGNQYLLEKYTISNLISADLINTTDRLPSDKQKINVLAAGVSQKFEGFDPLSNVPIELNAIVKSTQNVNGIFNGKQLLNQEFTRTSLRDNISGSNILHIATHGRFVPVDANASFLLLGNGDKLFIKELKNLIDDLNQVHLVVLSACQTALGGLGDDGVEISGISYYFLNGGAKAVIASLWAVNDDSTRQLDFGQIRFTHSVTSSE
jgi:CHAT domain-containing protein/tetratricopeptide (TPR) repeat protein